MAATQNKNARIDSTRAKEDCLVKTYLEGPPTWQIVPISAIACSGIPVVAIIPVVLIVITRVIA